MAEDKGKDIFEEEKPAKKSNPVFVNKKKGKVANINKIKNKITVEMPNGTGEVTDYIEERHSKLSIGDPIEF